ncbi:phasin family protein [Ferrovibrio sp.]|uniref:phasin family protein n=1 Tax=Ferrovibrio sp. TaxID=1917215 RepID=UPI001B709403|nr:TIGR01841 family phasin [Ferrovibrio sp.]MBP7066649.1 TIGR01841 family phasin [Ferrovibrio sp.]MBX3456639.1 TIGR01841 family phasin [Ferrovibrio sp.]
MTAKRKTAPKAETIAEALPSTAPLESVIFATKEQIEKAVKASTEATEKAFAATKQRLEAVAKSYGDAAKLSKDGVEAFVAAGTVASKGVENLNADLLAFAKSQYEGNIAAAKAIIAAKTLQEVVELQNGFTKSAFEAYTAQFSKFSEAATKLAQDSFAPINAQVQATVEKLVKPLAA